MQGFDVGDGEHASGHAGGDDHAARGELRAVGEHHHAIRVFATNRDDLLSGEQLRAKSPRLRGGPMREVGARDTRGKPEVILDQ